MSEFIQIVDDCPKWAESIIHRLRDLEVQLGNVLEPGESWSENNLTSLMQRLEGVDAQSKEAEAEDCFARISRDLMRQGYSSDKIAGYINTRLRGQSRLPYCNAREVETAGKSH